MVANCLLELAFELADRLEVALQHVGANHCEVVFAPLKLPCSSCDEIYCGQLISKVRDEKGSKSDVEWEHRLHSMCHIKR